MLLLLGPAWQFILKHRLPLDIPREWRREALTVQVTNLMLAALLVVMCLVVGVKEFLMLQLPITLLAGVDWRVPVLRAAPV